MACTGSGGTSSASASVTVTSDTRPPSVPIALTGAAVLGSQINLTWNASTDNMGVAGYHVYKNGSLVATVTTTSYVSLGLSPSTTYTYSVDAFDAAGNTSPQTASISVKTPNRLFSNGSRIMTMANADVRKQASTASTILCVQPQGSLGTITRPSKNANGHTWWPVQFDTGCSGWVVQTYLASATLAANPIAPSAALAAAKAITHTLSGGSTAPEVVTFQTILQTLNHYAGEITD